MSKAENRHQLVRNDDDGLSPLLFFLARIPNCKRHTVSSPSSTTYRTRQQQNDHPLTLQNLSRHNLLVSLLIVASCRVEKFCHHERRQCPFKSSTSVRDDGGALLILHALPFGIHSSFPKIFWSSTTTTATHCWLPLCHLQWRSLHCLQLCQVLYARSSRHSLHGPRNRLCLRKLSIESFSSQRRVWLWILQCCSRCLLCLQFLLRSCTWMRLLQLHVRVASDDWRNSSRLASGENIDEKERSPVVYRGGG